MNTSTRGPRFQSLGIGSRLTFRFLPFLVMAFSWFVSERDRVPELRGPNAREPHFSQATLGPDHYLGHFTTIFVLSSLGP
jgi:hypothetical protein